MRLAEGHRAVAETRSQVCVPRNSPPTCTKTSCLSHLPCLSKFSSLDQCRSPWSKSHLEPWLIDSHPAALSFFPLSDPITLIGKASTTASTSTGTATAQTTEHKSSHTLKRVLAQSPCAPWHGWHGINTHLHSSHQGISTNTVEKILKIIFNRDFSMSPTTSFCCRAGSALSCCTQSQSLHLSVSAPEFWWHMSQLHAYGPRLLLMTALKWSKWEN